MPPVRALLRLPAEPIVRAQTALVRPQTGETCSMEEKGIISSLVCWREEGGRGAWRAEGDRRHLEGREQRLFHLIRAESGAERGVASLG